MSDIFTDKIINMFSAAKQPCFICDELFTVLWLNDSVKDTELTLKKGDNLYDKSALSDEELNLCSKSIKAKNTFKGSFKISEKHYLPFEVMGFEGEDKKEYSLFIIDSSVKKLKEIDLDRITSVYRTSIFGINNVLSPLSSDLEEKSSTEDIKLVNSIFNECLKMMKTSVNTCEYYNLLTGDYKLSFSHCDMNSLFKKLTDQINIFLKNKSITFTSSQKNLLALIDFDKFLIAVLNVIANAIEFSAGEGEITISLDKQGDNIIVKVSDNGVGIPSDRIGLVFNPFYSFDSDTNMPKGVGLGLTVAKQIAEAHGGSIIVMSENLKGTDIVIRIPSIEASDGRLRLKSEPRYDSIMSNNMSVFYALLSDSFNSDLY